MTLEANNPLVQEAELPLFTAEGATAEIALAPEAPFAEFTPIASGMDTMLKGKKLLAGTALACASALGLAELPATPAAASGTQVIFLKAWRVGCRANGTSKEFGAKFTIKGLKNKDTGSTAHVKGSNDDFYILNFYPPTNNYTHKFTYYNPSTSHTRVPAGHPRVKAYFYRTQSGQPVEDPIRFRLPRC